MLSQRAFTFHNIKNFFPQAKESRPEKVRCFLDNLQRRGPDAFDKFLYCLRESGHDFVVSYVMQVRCFDIVLRL